MNNHKNARLTPHGRVLLVRRVVQEGLRPAEAAQAMGVSSRTAYKWLRRYREEGLSGLRNRTSKPQRCPHQTSAELIGQVIKRRRRRQSYRQIALQLGLGQSTVASILKRAGLNRLAYLDPPKPANRYEYAAPGDLLHLDIKKLGRFRRPGHRVTGDRRNTPKRGPGWEYVHIAIDDHSRLAFGSIHADEKAVSACKALINALATTEHWECVLLECSPTTVPPTAQNASNGCAGASACAITAPGPITRGPTAKPSALSRRRCGSGPTQAPTQTQITARSSCWTGSTSTTGIDRMPVSTISHQSVASQLMRTTWCVYTTNRCAESERESPHL
jgi:transposase-like protein